LLIKKEIDRIVGIPNTDDKVWTKKYQQTVPISSEGRASKHVSSSSAHVQPVQQEKRVELNNADNTDGDTPKTVVEKGK